MVVRGTDKVESGEAGKCEGAADAALGAPTDAGTDDDEDVEGDGPAGGAV